jgi:hypothetical protein
MPQLDDPRWAEPGTVGLSTGVGKFRSQRSLRPPKEKGQPR